MLWINFVMWLEFLPPFQSVRCVWVALSPPEAESSGVSPQPAYLPDRQPEDLPVSSCTLSQVLQLEQEQPKNYFKATQFFWLCSCSLLMTMLLPSPSLSSDGPQQDQAMSQGRILQDMCSVAWSPDTQLSRSGLAQLDRGGIAPFMMPLWPVSAGYDWPREHCSKTGTLWPPHCLMPEKKLHRALKAPAVSGEGSAWWSCAEGAGEGWNPCRRWAGAPSCSTLAHWVAKITDLTSVCLLAWLNHK